MKSDGTVVGWGQNDVNYPMPEIPDGLDNVIMVSAGLYHALALKSDGTVVAWGACTDYNWPGDWPCQTEVNEDLTDVIALAAGWDHSVVLKSDASEITQSVER